MLWSLPEWNMVRTVITARSYEVTAEYILDPTTCPLCGSEAFVRFGTREQKYKDCPRDNRHVTLLVQRRRYRCKDCGKIFHQPIPDLDDQHRLTKRLLHYIQSALVHQRGSEVAAAVGVSNATVSRILHAREQ